MLVIEIPVHADRNNEHSQSGRAPLHHLVAMLGSVLDAVAYLIDELVVL